MRIIDTGDTKNVIIEDVSVMVAGELDSSLRELGYKRIKDYNITSMPFTSFKLRVNMYVTLHGDALLEDHRVKELLVEYLI